MDSEILQSSRFKQVMQLIIFLGIGTNFTIAYLLFFISAYEVLFSPIAGTVIFIICYLLLIKNKLTVNQAFLITGYTVAAEVIIHTHYLGWDAGFFYFFYALSVVFLLDFSWKIKSVVIFNGLMIILTIVTGIIYKGKTGHHPIPIEYTNNLNTFNQAVVGLVVLVIIIYFSYNNGKNDKTLKMVNFELEKQNIEISEQRNHLQILLNEVHHRVKNNLQIISSLLSLQQQSLTDEKMITILSESKSRVEAIALIHEKLYNNNRGNQVDFKSYLKEILNSQKLIQSNVKCKLESIDLVLDLDYAVPLGLVLSEMITNSVKHAFKNIANPKLDISIVEKNTKNEFEIVVQDNGVGFPENFSLVQPKSLGIEIIVALIDQIGGRIEFCNEKGAKFIIGFKIDK
ncbi:MAG: sensor histidine kinase [Crocinitomicaceae bacterium]